MSQHLDVPAPVLFNLLYDAIIAATLSHHKDSGCKVLYNIGDLLVGSKKKMKNEVDINDLEYADDIAIISDSMDTLEEIKGTLHAVCSGMGLSTSTRKTKILAVCPSSLPAGMQPIQIYPAESRQ
jgi:hypothetical protein